MLRHSVNMCNGGETTCSPRLREDETAKEMGTVLMVVEGLLRMYALLGLPPGSHARGSQDRCTRWQVGLV